MSAFRSADRTVPDPRHRFLLHNPYRFLEFPWDLAVLRSHPDIFHLHENFGRRLTNPTRKMLFPIFSSSIMLSPCSSDTFVFFDNFKPQQPDPVHHGDPVASLTVRSTVVLLLVISDRAIDAAAVCPPPVSLAEVRAISTSTAPLQL